VAGSAVAKQQDVDALVVLDLPAERPRFVALRVNQGDQVLRLGARRDGMDGRPDAKYAESRDQ